MRELQKGEGKMLEQSGRSLQLLTSIATNVYQHEEGLEPGPGLDPAVPAVRYRPHHESDPEPQHATFPLSLTQHQTYL